MKRQQKREAVLCSICGCTIADRAKNPLWLLGNNAAPVNNGRCCDVCNDLVVIPARLQRFFAAASSKQEAAQ